MKILWVSHFVPYPPAGGVLQRGYGLISHLSASCELHLLAMNQPRLIGQTLGKHANALDEAIEKLRPFCASIRTQSIPSETGRWGRHRAAALAMLMGRSYTQEWLASRAMYRAVTDAIATVRPDLIHFDTISLAPYIEAVQSSLPVSLGHHNVESHMMRRRALKSTSKLQRLFLSAESARILELERRYVPRANLNVVCSRVDGKRLQRLAHARAVHVAENGVLEAEVTTEDLRDPEHFANVGRRSIFVGRMSAYTNRDAADFLAERIWPQLSRRFSDATLDIVGSGPPESVINLAQRDTRVRALGFVKDLKSVLTPGIVFICPIRDGGGTKLKILDAMNRGLPIVAHPIALEGIDVVPDVHVLVARTPEQFAEQTGRLFADPALRMQLAQRAFEQVRKHYAFESIAHALAERFASVIRERAH